MDCIFCQIIRGELPSKLVYKDDEIMVFYDIHPKAPTHVLIVPIEHFESLRDVDESHTALLGSLFVKSRMIADRLNLSEDGYKIVINNGKGAGQIVFHLHVHLLGGWKKSPGWEV